MSILGVIGAEARGRSSYLLQLTALSWGVMREGIWPSTWRRTLRADFRTILTRVVGGSLGTIAVTAFIVGLGLVFEALYWLRTAGQEEQIGRILVIVLFREITPLLVGIILLGRGGTAAIAELGTLAAEGEVTILRAEGIDIFDYLVLPRAVSFALGAFTLGMVFVDAFLDQWLRHWQRVGGGEYVDLRLPGQRAQGNECARPGDFPGQAAADRTGRGADLLRHRLGRGGNRHPVQPAAARLHPGRHRHPGGHPAVERRSVTASPVLSLEAARGSGERMPLAPLDLALFPR